MMAGTTVDRGDRGRADQYGFTRRGLRGYDLFAFRFCAPYCWRCPVSEFTELYDRYASARHLDIGVGTGYLMDRARFPVPHPQITLMDLNPDPLAHAAQRLRRYAPKTHQASVVAPWELPPGSFESIAMCNVLHCVPGTMPEKAVAFQHAREALAPGGWLFGSAVLGKEVEHTRLSRKVMKDLNKRDVFFNLDDGVVDLEAGLNKAFGSCEVEVHGAIAVFAAQAA